MTVRWVAVFGVVAFVLAACYPPVPPGDSYAVRWGTAMSGPTNEDEFDGIAAGAGGSAFVTGKFEQSVTLGGTTLTSAGRADIPLARFDQFGRPLWVQRFGGTGEDNLFDIDADANGAVGTGWFAGTVDFGPVRLRAAGASDCVVVAVDNAGAVRWARALGGPYRDGCNEVTIAADGSIVTSLDTEGGWTPPGHAAIPRLDFADTLLVHLSPGGDVQWMRRVGGPGPQRGKSLAVAPDGSIVFGGDTIGGLDVAGTAVTVPNMNRDAWISRWSAAGAQQWTKTWGGPGDDLAKGVVATADAVFVVGPFTGATSFGGVTLDAGTNADLAVVRFSTSGTLAWATSVRAPGPVDGAEAIAAADGGLLFGSTVTAGLQFGSAGGAYVPVDTSKGGTAWLAHYRPDGSLGFAATIAGTANGNIGEIARGD
ncbi:MAG TPA: hypothetical protein VFX21_10125, partial [Acidimicrobiia bacterium]|nr:hypothetical protein [Acidimicrobiia bacterium]